MTGEADMQKKSPDDQPQEKSSPFLISGSKVTDGSGFGMVLAVGLHSQSGIMRSNMEKEDTQTPLQLKLTDLSEMIGNIGMLGAGLTVAGCTLGLVLSCIFNDDQQLFSIDTLNQFFSFIILGITIIVMAVPEGLPMAVVIALAYSVEKMRQKNNLVREMGACETMGNVSDICSDKTGTLTENNMTVIDVYYSGNHISVTSGTFDRLKRDNDLVDMCRSVAINSTATPDFKIPLKEQIGNRTEMALMEFCHKMDLHYQNEREVDRIIHMLPFSSARKKMLTAYKHKDGKVFLHLKGAPEIVLESCTFYRSEQKTYKVERDFKDNLDKNVLKIISDKKARSVAVARVELDSADISPETDLTTLANNMVFLGVFGIMDPVRADVPNAVAKCAGAYVNVRMVTGDNTAIGAAIAKECGFLRKDWSPETDDNEVMDGKKFRELLGGYQQKITGEGKERKVEYQVGDMHAFQKIEPKLRVIGRCLPQDKLLLVLALQKLGKVVAVTGDGANDAPALNRADVGLGMGKTGTDICKDASKIVLLDDNFASIVTAIQYGRNIFDAIKKFIKFQLTVNLVAMAIAITCGFIIKESPINAIQMLWINVIMDSFASLALATEPPVEEQLERPPTRKREPIVSQNIWNAVVFQAVCQFVILMAILFLSPSILGLESTIGMKTFDYDRAKHYTFFFNCFVFMQMFNFVNSRVIKRSEINPFQNICSNPIFWFIVALTFIGQVMFVELIGAPVRCSPLPLRLHLISLAIGSLSIFIGMLQKLLPEINVPLMFKEKEEVDKYSVTKGIMSATNMGIYRRGSKSQIYK